MTDLRCWNEFALIKTNVGHEAGPGAVHQIAIEQILQVLVESFSISVVSNRSERVLIVTVVVIRVILNA